MPTPPWPLFSLRLVTDRLVLRPPTDDDLGPLVEVAGAGVHDPATMPFRQEWTDQPPAQLEWGLLQWQWRIRGGLCPSDWNIGFLVERRADGAALGVQDLLARDFAIRRTVGSGSWLGREHQGNGYGREMRSAVLELAFVGLGAEVAETSAWADNGASIGVTRALGYRENGEGIDCRRGAPSRELRFRLDRSDWLAADRPEVGIEGLDGVKRLLGLGDDGRGAPGAG